MTARGCPASTHYDEADEEGTESGFDEDKHYDDLGQLMEVVPVLITAEP